MGMPLSWEVGSFTEQGLLMISINLRSWRALTYFFLLLGTFGGCCILIEKQKHLGTSEESSTAARRPCPSLVDFLRSKLFICKIWSDFPIILKADYQDGFFMRSFSVLISMDCVIFPRKYFYDSLGCPSLSVIHLVPFVTWFSLLVERLGFLMKISDTQGQHLCCSFWYQLCVAYYYSYMGCTRALKGVNR